MYRLCSIAALAVILAFGVYGGQVSVAAQSAPAARPLGLIPPRSAVRNDTRRTAANNLDYNGGPVQTGTHTTYAIFWGAPATFADATYQSLITTYLHDVAADSGKTSNVYSSDTQYYQTANGTKTNVTYKEAFGGSWTDPTNPASKCASTDGGTVACVNDRQIRLEVRNAIAANGWPDGLGNEYFVFLGKGISTCVGGSCFVRNWCAYHSDFTDAANQPVLYANIPYTSYDQHSCINDASPNGDMDADSTINILSHEANETITDPLGTAWYDSSGSENGDKCSWRFGRARGSTASGKYNQVINGHYYLLQGEWSNKIYGCVWPGT